MIMAGIIISLIKEGDRYRWDAALGWDDINEFYKEISYKSDMIFTLKYPTSNLDDAVSDMKSYASMLNDGQEPVEIEAFFSGFESGLKTEEYDKLMGVEQGFDTYLDFIIMREGGYCKSNCRIGGNDGKDLAEREYDGEHMISLRYHNISRSELTEAKKEIKDIVGILCGYHLEMEESTQ